MAPGAGLGSTRWADSFGTVRTGRPVPSRFYGIGRSDKLSDRLGGGLFLGEPPHHDARAGMVTAFDFPETHPEDDREDLP